MPTSCGVFVLTMFSIFDMSQHPPSRENARGLKTNDWEKRHAKRRL